MTGSTGGALSLSSVTDDSGLELAAKDEEFLLLDVRSVEHLKQGNLVIFYSGERLIQGGGVQGCAIRGNKVPNRHVAHMRELENLIFWSFMRL